MSAIPAADRKDSGVEEEKEDSSADTTNNSAQLQLEKELRDQAQHPPKWGSAAPRNLNNPLNWTALLYGPASSPFVGGLFELKLVFPETYPASPPTVTFITEIYHPNVDSSNGSIKGLEICGAGWRKHFTVGEIMEEVRELMRVPDVVKAKVGQIALEYWCEREEYNSTASEWTGRFANGEAREGRGRERERREREEGEMV